MKNEVETNWTINMNLKPHKFYFLLQKPAPNTTFNLRLFDYRWKRKKMAEIRIENRFVSKIYNK